ncbi:MAG: hypothetical protein K6C40_00830 [Thermoguttaceae bacterium]|nr:hypothetical protein [Thermoguttaceae bacterium]
MRKNQALSIALILFVIIACVLGGTTYYFKKNADELLIAKDQAVSVLPGKDAKIEELSNEIQVLKSYLGTEDELSAITQKYNENMKIVARDGNAAPVGDLSPKDDDEKPEGEDGENEGGEDGEKADGDKDAPRIDDGAAKPNYQTVIAYLNEKIKDQNALSAKIEELNTEITTLKEQVEKAREEGKKLGEDMVKEQYEANIQNLEKQIADRERTIDETKVRFREQKKAKETEQKKVRRLEGEKKDLQKKNQESSEKIEKLEEIRRESKLPPAESKMGELVYVDPLGKQGNINLGKKDFLTRGITFSVYEPNNMTEYGMKGTIEVLSVTDDREAEVIIYNNDESDPIKVGDVIYTPTWAPGFEEHFAIAGFVDIDGDNSSDLEEIIRLIRQNGGVVDAWQKVDGKQEGKITSETSWLVLGRKPDEKSSQASLTTYTNMTRAADEYGTKVQQVKDLLRKMGYRPPADTTNFEVRPTIGTKGRSSTGNVSGLYSKEPDENVPKRKPPKSAY